MPRNKGWFRLYDRMIDSPQVLELNDSEFRLLVSLWCLCSAEGGNGTVSYTAAAIRRRVMPDHSLEDVKAMIEHLKQLDLLAGEDRKYTIPRWEKHQYEYNSRIPSNRSDLKKVTEDSGETSENLRKENGKDSENEWKDNGKIDTDTETDTETDPEKDIIPPLPPQGEESSASATPATLPELLARYNPEQQKVIHDYFDMLKFTRKTGRIAKNIMLRELSYWGRYPPEIVIEALSIHIQRYSTKREDYTRGIIRRIYREKGGQNGTDWKQNTGTYPGDPGPTTESQRLEQLAREKGLIKDGEIHDIDCPF